MHKKSTQVDVRRAYPLTQIDAYLKLVYRYIRKTWTVQLGMAVFFATACTMLLLYGIYVDRQRDLLSVRIEDRLLDDLVIVSLPAVQEQPNTLFPYRGAQPPPIELVASWSLQQLPTSSGTIPFAILSSGSETYLPLGGVRLGEALADRLGLAIGDNFEVKGYGSRVVEGYHEKDIFGDRAIIAGVSPESSHYMYKTLIPDRSGALEYASRVYPGANIVHSQSSTGLAGQIISAAYSPGKRATYELGIFVFLAFQSVCLFGFLERRRSLAVLKALGMRARELGAVFFAENVLAPLAGAFTGVLLGFIGVSRLKLLGEELSLSGQVARAALAILIPAMFLSTTLPIRLVSIGTVNQLMFERAIPLFFSRVRTLQKREVALETYIEQGVAFIKIGLKEEKLPHVFRKVGEQIKAGETLAYLESWGGLVVTEYLAPATGVVVVIQQETGLVGIAPRNVDERLVQDLLRQGKRGWS